MVSTRFFEFIDQIDWIKSIEDGKFHLEPPIQIQVDPQLGRLSFPLIDALQLLGFPSFIQLLGNGDIQIQLDPEHKYLKNCNALEVPIQSELINFIPPDFIRYQNKDESYIVALPKQGIRYNDHDNTLNISHYWPKKILPDCITITCAGTLFIHLPNQGVEYLEDGSIILDLLALEFMQNKIPDYIRSIYYAKINYNGNVSFDIPEDIDIDDGIIHLSYEDQQQYLPKIDNFHINNNGTSSINLPDESYFDLKSNTLNIVDPQFNIDQIPDCIESYLNPDDSISCILENGMKYKTNQNILILDNYWTNKIFSDFIHINIDGSIDIQLPKKTKLESISQITIDYRYIDFYKNSYPYYLNNVSFSTLNKDGSYTFKLPNNLSLNEKKGQLCIPFEALYVLPLDDHLEVTPSGTLKIQLPSNTIFDESLQSLSFAPNEIHPDEIPYQVDYKIKNNGTIQVYLKDGMDYSHKTKTLHLDHYWTNELTPSNIDIQSDGSIIIKLPIGTIYHNDHSISLLKNQVNFLENSPPLISQLGVQWIKYNPDGSITILKNALFKSNPQEHTLHFNVDTFNQEFSKNIPNHIQLINNGTIKIQLSQGLKYNPESQTILLPKGEAHIDQFPEFFLAETTDNGSISIQLQEGMNFIPESRIIELDNYWSNCALPDPINLDIDGNMQITLPHNSHYHSNGDIQIPESSAYFIEDPFPFYIEHGPEWIDHNLDGSIRVTPPANTTINAQAKTLTLPYDLLAHGVFHKTVGIDMYINTDGSASLGIPKDCIFNPELNTLTFSSRSIHFQEIPDGIEYHILGNKDIVIHIPDEMEYDPETHLIIMSNDWVNELMPNPVKVHIDGSIVIDLPVDTHFFDNSSFVISSSNRDFLYERSDLD